MPLNLHRLLAAASLALVLSACTTPPALHAVPVQPGQLAGTDLRLDCPLARAALPNAVYIGPYLGVENQIPLRELAQDIHCADAFKARDFPAGFVSIYGSSRIKEQGAPCDARRENCDPALLAANAALYADVRAFARDWTTRFGRRYPILTGAGPGLMEAGNRGALEAGGASVGYTTYYDPAPNPSAARPYGGKPDKALNAYVTHGLIFSSVAVREYAMIKHSAAMVIAPGGTGTEWEIFQIIETLKSRQLSPVPVYLLGDRPRHWASLEARLNDMVARKTLNREEIAFVKFVPTSAELLTQLSADLGLDAGKP